MGGPSERVTELALFAHHVQLSVDASIRLDRMSEAAAFLEAAQVAAPRGEATLSIARGDAAYLAGDRAAARAHCDRAARMTWPPGEDELARLRGNAAAG